MADDSVTICGNLTRDPELKYTPSGQAVAEFTVARNNRRRKEDGTWEDGDPGFYDVSVWNEHAENVAESLAKGMRVMVYGNLQFDKWETDDGQKRSKVRIRASEVGASLRWTTVMVEQRERSSKPPVEQGPPPRKYHDEEPF